MENEKANEVPTTNDCDILAEVFAEKRELAEKVKCLEWRLVAAEESEKRAWDWLTFALIPYISVVVSLLVVSIFNLIFS